MPSGLNWCLWFHNAIDDAGMTVCNDCEGAWYFTQSGYMFTQDIETIVMLSTEEGSQRFSKMVANLPQEKDPPKQD